MIPHITQRFFRTKKTRVSQASGSGLGLSIVEEILKKHGTMLQIDSELLVGSVITFTLPRTALS